MAHPPIRVGVPDDVPDICAFGSAVVGPHYAPLIGDTAAAGQVQRWWNAAEIGAAVDAGNIVVAHLDDQLVGVGQRGEYDGAPVIWKLYVHPDHRGDGLGPRLIEALIAPLPPEADRVYLEHFASNERAGAFYQREGFVVDRIEPSPNGDERSAVVWRVRQR